MQTKAQTFRGLAYERLGSGEPLILIHGTGSSRAAWRPVVPFLQDDYELLMVDLPGHGESELLGDLPNPIGYAPLLAKLLETVGLGSAHAAGFSVGGWTALELARLGRTRSVVAFGPAGLWSPRSPRLSEASIGLTWLLSRAFKPVLPLLFRWPPLRNLLITQMFGQPSRVPADAALEAARGYGATRGFHAHRRAVNRGRFSGGQMIDVPVTVAFGTRERLLFSKRARLSDELPPQTRWLELPGCGHVPTWDDPILVYKVIRDTTIAASDSS